MIFDAAARVFAEEGYHFARISKVCQAAGISNGALYKYFRNKEDLFFSVLDHAVTLIINNLYARFTVNAESIFTAVDQFLWGLVSFAEDYRDYLSIYSDLGSSSLKRFAFSASEKFETTASMYTISLVEKSIRRGEINIKLQKENAAYLIDSHITFFVYSLVSEYHCKRFDSFYAGCGKQLTVSARIKLIVDSLKQTLA